MISQDDRNAILALAKKHNASPELIKAMEDYTKPFGQLAHEEINKWLMAKNNKPIVPKPKRA